MDADTLYSAFLQCDEYAGTDKKMLRENFNALIEVMGLSVAKLCRCANYDPSAIFRFRRGERQPAEPEQFAAAVANHVAAEVNDPDRCAVLAELLDCVPESIADPEQCRQRVKTWLLDGHGRPENDVSSFLTKLDEFDLNEYIKVIHFDELKVPVAPFQLPTSRSYSGLRQMMDSELDFMKAAVLSRSTEPVFMYSDMPMTEMAKDPEFPKKWMFGMAMMLKKGLHLNQIHNLDRSFEEMMLGLESWIPMYMTGQISPYYFKEAPNSVFLHFLKVSGAAALSGEAIAGHHPDGKYYLTNSKRELKYYQKRAEDMLSNACPLMDIYRSERESELNTFLLADASRDGARRSILSTLPLYTMSDELLDYLEELNRRTFVLVEYGIESANDETLKRINRGHDFACCRDAVERTHARGILTGAHIIIGLPGEDAEESLRQAPIISSLPIDILKIHQMQIIRGTRLAQEYAEHPFHVYTVEEYIDVIVKYIRLLRKDLVLERFVSQSPKDLLIAPKWGLKNYEFTNLLNNKLKSLL